MNNKSFYDRIRDGELKDKSLFHIALSEEFNVENNPKESLLFEIACEKGKWYSGSLEDVIYEYRSLLPLIE